MASYRGDMERHLFWWPCTKVHCCDQHKCPDISNQFPKDQVVHYGKHFHDFLQCAALVWESHEGKRKLIKRYITDDHGSFVGIFLRITNLKFIGTIILSTNSPTQVFGPEMIPGAEVRGVTFLVLSQQFPA